MSYKVSIWTDYGREQSPAPKFYMNRAQAIAAMRKLAYATLEAFGKLDTVAAHDVMQTIDRCDDILSPQAQRHVHISNTGYTLTLSNTARQPRG